MTKAERLEKFEAVDIYPVTCEKLSTGRTDIDVLHGIIEGGAKIVQLREKDITKRELFDLAVRFRALTGQHGLLLIINDHIDIALAVGADGVHLGQDDLPLSAARSIAGEIIIGISTHNENEAKRAQSGGADYVNIGPIFKTETKEGADEFLGVESIGTISRHLDIPFTVMGGIDLGNVESVVKEGASKVAVVSAVTKASDIPGAVRAFKDILNR